MKETNNAVTEDIAINTADVAKEDTIMAGTVNNAVAGGTVTQIGQVETNMYYMTIDELMQKLDNDEIRMDLPVQRKPDQWDEKKQSALLLSVERGYPIPSICFLEMDGKLMVADGIQRITALRKFKNDDLCISINKDEKLILTDDRGNTHEISGKKYTELDSELRERFCNFNLKVDIVTGADKDTASDIFNRLNSGVPMSKAQTCRGALGIEMAGYMDELCQKPYIAVEGKYTTTQQKIDAPFESLLQGATLLDNCFEHPGRRIYNCKNISNAEVKEYCHFISKNYSEEQKKELEEVLDYLGKMGMVKAIDKTMIPMLIVMAKLALLNDINPKDFTTWASLFIVTKPQAYTNNMGSTNISKPKTIGRLKAMRDSFAEYCSKHGIKLDVKHLKPELLGSKTKKTAKAATKAKTSDKSAPATEVTNEATPEPVSNAVDSETAPEPVNNVADSETTPESDSNTGGSVANPEPDSNVVDSETTSEPDSNTVDSETVPELDSNTVDSETAPEPDINTGGVDTAGDVSEEPQKEITE